MYEVRPIFGMSKVHLKLPKLRKLKSLFAFQNSFKIFFHEFQPVQNSHSFFTNLIFVFIAGYQVKELSLWKYSNFLIPELMNWWIDELMNRWFDERMNWWIDELINWWIEELMNWWKDELMNWWIDELMKETVEACLTCYIKNMYETYITIIVISDIDLSIYLFIYISIYLSFYLSLYIYLLIHLSFSVYIYISVY